MAQVKKPLDLGPMLTIADSLEALRRLAYAIGRGENVEDNARTAEVLQGLLESQIEEAHLEASRGHVLHG